MGTVSVPSTGISKKDVERYRTAVDIIKLIVTKLVDELSLESFVLSSSGNVFICLFQLLSNMQEVLETYLKNLYRFESLADSKDKSQENDTAAVLAEKNGLRTSLHIFQHIWRLFGDKPAAYWKLIRSVVDQLSMKPLFCICSFFTSSCVFLLVAHVLL